MHTYFSDPPQYTCKYGNMVLSNMAKYKTWPLVLRDESNCSRSPRRMAMDNSNTAAYHIHTKYKTAIGTYKKQLTTRYYWVLIFQNMGQQNKKLSNTWHPDMMTCDIMISCCDISGVYQEDGICKNLMGYPIFVCMWVQAFVIFQGRTLRSKNNPKYSKKWMWNEHMNVAWVFHNVDIMGYLNIPDIPWISMCLEHWNNQHLVSHFNAAK
jgi:hypothetical protein